MAEVNLHYAKTHLSRLVDSAMAGEEVVIARAGVPLVELKPLPPRRAQRVLGLDQGRVILREDFEEPLSELEELFYGDENPP